MKAIILCLGVILLSCTVFAEEIENSLPDATKIRRRGKRCNVNICFAIDGSENILPFHFKLQKIFIRKVVRRLSRGNSINAAAVQYGLLNRVISPVTRDMKSFFKKLRVSTFADASRSSAGAGVVYCHFQLRKISERGAKMVVFGTGKSDLGGSAAVRAGRFRNAGGEVFAIGVGKANFPALKGIAGVPKNVYFLRYGRISKLVDAFLFNLCR